MTREYDIGFVVVLREEDKSSDLMGEIKWKTIPGDHNLELSSGVVYASDNREVKLAKLIIDDQGPDIAGIQTTKYLNLISCKMLILVGISGRVSADCNIGDAVIGKSCDNPLYRTKIAKGEKIAGGQELSLGGISRKVYREIMHSNNQRGQSNCFINDSDPNATKLSPLSKTLDPLIHLSILTLVSSLI